LLDVRATTSIITHLLYLSPKRNLLYVTDIDIFGSEARPTHIFEHLSCFLPGLLALGVHTLPLDRLDELGIDLDKLGNENMYGFMGEGYKTLKGYNLKELHMWAAEGLAHTCWVTYADQPTGLGPDEMAVLAWGRKPEEERKYRWIEAVDKWKGSGGRGIIPGLADPVPMIYSEEERRSGNATRRDYVLRKVEYLLRPEVSDALCCEKLWCSRYIGRRSSRCIYYGALLVTRSGGGGGGGSLRPLSEKQRQ
jgi:mannosyl-oligosaccharide alpha-1,2-mannosidase